MQGARFPVPFNHIRNRHARLCFGLPRMRPLQLGLQVKVNNVGHSYSGRTLRTKQTTAQGRRLATLEYY
jgi:hypothetical protein